jgi:hypothetical protein
VLSWEDCHTVSLKAAPPTHKENEEISRELGVMAREARFSFLQRSRTLPLTIFGKENCDSNASGKKERSTQI